MAAESGAEQKPGDLDELPAALTAEYCFNCGILLTGPYCAACGQKKRPQRIGFRDFLHELLHEFLHLDGKFARTMGLLLARPGLLTVEFLAGRRATFVSPLRLYLVWSAVSLTLALSSPSAVVLKVEGTAAKSSVESAQTTPASRAIGSDTELQKRLNRIRQDPKFLADAFLRDSAKGMFLLMPFFALLLHVFYKKQEPFYLPHLYFSIHYHTFVAIAMSIHLLLRTPRIGVLDKLAAIPELSVMIYLYLALRRVYGASRLGTTWRMIGIGLIYMIGLGATFGAIVVYRLFYG